MDAVALAAPARRDATSSTVSLEITDWFEAPIDLPDAACEFAIGDVHGHLAQLECLLPAMARAAGGRGHLTFLGDLIDRGPSSLACVRAATRPAEALGFEGRTLLLGNHEMLMLMAVSARPDAADAQDVWVANGGDRTLAEAGQTPNTLMLRTELCRTALERALGEEAAQSVSSAGLSRQAGNILFVHAGIDPGVPLARALERPRLTLSDDRHPCWIRFPFLHHEGAFEGGRTRGARAYAGAAGARRQGAAGGGGVSPAGRVSAWARWGELRDGGGSGGGVSAWGVSGV